MTELYIAKLTIDATYETLLHLCHNGAISGFQAWTELIARKDVIMKELIDDSNISSEDFTDLVNWATEKADFLHDLDEC